MLCKTVNLALFFTYLTLVKSVSIESEIIKKQEIPTDVPETLKLYNIVKQLLTFVGDIEKLKKQLNEEKLKIEDLEREKMELENEKSLTLTQMNDVTRQLASVKVENEQLKKELDENEQVKEIEKLRKEKIESELERNVTSSIGTNLQGIEESLKIMETKFKSKDIHKEEVAVKDGYTLTPGIGYHKIYTNAKNWNDARKSCSEDGAHLAIINSQAEEKLLTDMYEDVKHKIKGVNHYEFPKQIYLGVHDMYEEGDWITIFGESIETTGYVHWSTGQPNNVDGDQNCGTLYFYDEGGMNDVECSFSFAYACEITI